MYNNKSDTQKKDGSDSASFTIFYNIRISGNKRRDLDNQIASVNDCLVSSGLLPDDSYKTIQRQLIGFTQVEKSQEGVDLIIIKDEHK